MYDNHLVTLIDLIRQLSEQQLPNGKPLLMSDYTSPFYKIIAKYFSHDGKDISVDTVRNYFVRKEEGKAIKGSQIPDDKKLFRIVPK